MHERTFSSALEWSALLSTSDSNHTDSVVLRGAVIGDEHLSVRFRYYDLPLLPT